MVLDTCTVKVDDPLALLALRVLPVGQQELVLPQPDGHARVLLKAMVCKEITEYHCDSLACPAC